MADKNRAAGGCPVKSGTKGDTTASNDQRAIRPDGQKQGEVKKSRRPVKQVRYQSPSVYSRGSSHGSDRSSTPGVRYRPPGDYQGVEIYRNKKRAATPASAGYRAHAQGKREHSATPDSARDSPGAVSVIDLGDEDDDASSTVAAHGSMSPSVRSGISVGGMFATDPVTDDLPADGALADMDRYVFKKPGSSKAQVYQFKHQVPKPKMTQEELDVQVPRFNESMQASLWPKSKTNTMEKLEREETEFGVYLINQGEFASCGHHPNEDGSQAREDHAWQAQLWLGRKEAGTLPKIEDICKCEKRFH